VREAPLDQEGDEAPPRNPIIFLLSDGEEPILLGAEAFVAAQPWAANVGVVVNLEASGTSEPSILFETTEHNARLIAAFAAHAPKPVTSSMYDVLFEFLSFNTVLPRPATGSGWRCTWSAMRPLACSLWTQR
jgi:hypothetical protein